MWPAKQTEIVFHPCHLPACSFHSHPLCWHRLFTETATLLNQLFFCMLPPIHTSISSSHKYSSLCQIGLLFHHYFNLWWFCFLRANGYVCVVSPQEQSVIEQIVVNRKIPLVCPKMTCIFNNNHNHNSRNLFYECRQTEDLWKVLRSITEKKMAEQRKNTMNNSFFSAYYTIAVTKTGICWWKTDRLRSEIDFYK